MTCRAIPGIPGQVRDGFILWLRSWFNFHQVPFSVIHPILIHYLSAWLLDHSVHVVSGFSVPIRSAVQFLLLSWWSILYDPILTLEGSLIFSWLICYWEYFGNHSVSTVICSSADAESCSLRFSLQQRTPAHRRIWRRRWGGLPWLWGDEFGAPNFWWMLFLFAHFEAVSL